mmetsp:Transcript_8507/g.21242  ORF Transcript_8507/g.21242 Transcript_8507/m.21242 type:complete len:80 (+) Transcript_8507:4218-4457(+)
MPSIAMEVRKHRNTNYYCPVASLPGSTQPKASSSSLSSFFSLVASSFIHSLYMVRRSFIMVVTTLPGLSTNNLPVISYC